MDGLASYRTLKEKKAEEKEGECKSTSHRKHVSGGSCLACRTSEGHGTGRGGGGDGCGMWQK